MTENTEEEPDDLKKKKKSKNRFAHLFNKGRKPTKKQYNNDQFEQLMSLYKRELTLRELLYHKAPIGIIKRQSVLVTETKIKLKELGLNDDDLKQYANKHWIDVLDNDMDARLRERCPFWQEYAKKTEVGQTPTQPCSGPCLGLFCPKRKKTKLRKKE